MSKSRFAPCWLRVLMVGALSLAAEEWCFAGHEIVPPDKDVKDAKVQPEDVRTFFPNDPAGLVTLGLQFSEHGSGLYVDSITGLWAPRARDAFLFLNSTYHWEDNGQFSSSTGLGFRQMLAGRQIIVGGNLFWDSIHSERGNDYDQLGLGLEMLTHWVDARFNYYLPDGEHHEVDRHSDTDVITTFLRGVAERATRRQTFARSEAALEGFQSEIGFLLPGLDRYAEVRVFGGYHRFVNPFGSDFEGFQGRLEARLVPAVIVDVEYWDDDALMGGHWTAGLRVSVPFSIYNLATGRNPFEGAAKDFQPGPREFQERLSEMVIRSHRIQTTTSSVEKIHDRREASNPTEANVTPALTPFPIE